MDLLSMLMHAKITDVDGYVVGEIITVHITKGSLSITIDIESDEDEDPDDGEEINGDYELDNTEEVSKPTQLRLVTMGEK